MPNYTYDEYEDWLEAQEQESGFDQIINKLIEHEVNKRLGEKKKDYDSLIERDKKSQKELSEKRNEIWKLERELKDAEKIYVKKGVDDAKREMLGGHKLGDERYVVRRIYKSENCSNCKNRSGKVKAIYAGLEVEAKCPICAGRGYKSWYDYKVERVSVEEIKIHTYAKEQVKKVQIYVYPLDYRGDSIGVSNLEDLFVNKEDCVEHMEKLKKEDK